jgi:hypothetical protein
MMPTAKRKERCNAEKTPQVKMGEVKTAGCFRISFGLQFSAPFVLMNQHETGEQEEEIKSRSA